MSSVAAEPDAAAEALYQSSFEAMLADPADLEKAFAHARAAIAVDDFEGAIGTLERMLLLNPDLPQVRLELGVLYFRLGSYVAAKGYLLEIAEDDRLPGPLAARVQGYLAAIDKRLASNRFDGSAIVGLRYQTNANAGPESRDVRLFGLNARLDDEFSEQDDTNLFGILNLGHVYDFEAQNGVTLESNLTAYGTLQDQEDQLNLILLDADTGPRIPLPAGDLVGLSVRPFVTAGHIRLDDHEYSTMFGGGVGLDATVTPLFQMGFTGMVRSRQYSDGANRTSNSDQDGEEWTAKMDVHHRVGPDTRVSGSALFIFEGADVDHEESRTHGFTLSTTHNFRPEFALTPAPWTVMVSGGLFVTHYDSPDPVVDPNVKRVDRETRLAATLVVPFAESWNAIGSASVRDIDSSLPNYEFSNIALTLGAMYRF
ncbi:tetratricopeptide repeat protein [Oceanibacterium hippocampi]|uniref:Tetratricopeptide repeat protein n=1 Tax=Oceanibacterium hippocampi TaxID=745714 RepID=A0A1Y5RE48_9PROT|nr:tetratricopeptide repeat protein [Oceanibacterium hippocampi]SLN12569.1 hypothetical protein OCH7691_00165 [Oceanibacterium hippocampi]